MSANRLRIVNRQALTRVVNAIEEEYGSQNKAAKAIGIGQGTFSRLQNAVTRELDYGTFRRLVEWCGGSVDPSGRPEAPPPFSVDPDAEPPSDAEALEREGSGATQPREDELGLASDVERERPTWWTDQKEVDRRGRLYEDLERSVLGEGGSLVLDNYRLWLATESRRLGRALSAVSDLKELRRIIRAPKYRRVFESFANRVGRDSPYPDRTDRRYWIAVHRALEPVVAASEATWGVERGWREMHSAGDLAAYLQHALSREAALMDREPDLRRAAAIKPPMSWADWMAKTVRPWEDLE